MDEKYYQGLCGVAVKEVWEDDMMNVTCDRAMECSAREKRAHWLSAMHAGSALTKLERNKQLRSK